MSCERKGRRGKDIKKGIFKDTKMVAIV